MGKLRKKGAKPDRKISIFMKFARSLFILIPFAFLACSSRDEAVFTVTATDFDLVNTPVFVDITSNTFDEDTPLCLHHKGGSVAGQIETLENSQQRLWWLVNLKAGESKRFNLRTENSCHSGLFSWKTINKFSTRLVKGDKPVIQYEHPVFDADDFYTTQKPFHHVFHPSGNSLITKGDPDGLYPHHRGIFFGYNKVHFNDKEINIWAARNGVSEHAGFVQEFAGPVMGGNIVKIYWKDEEGKSFIEETREVRLFNQDQEEILIDFHSTLRALAGPVRLDGDRQHAGVQFRATEFVANHPEKTKFIRPASWSHLGPSVEIDGKDIYNLPWNAMHYALDESGSGVTVAYMSHPGNPENAEMSERCYGRFGEFFPYTVTANNPLTVNYRFYIKNGEVDSESIDLRYKAYENRAEVMRNK
jgi:hypothetical protein